MFENARKIRNEQTAEDKLTERSYNFILSITIIYGLLITGITAWFGKDYIEPTVFNTLIIVIGFFAFGIMGAFVVHFNNNPFISFLGYHLLTIPAGLLLTLILQENSVINIMFAMKTALGIVLTMMAVGYCFPAVFKNMKNGLFTALVITIIGEIVAIFFGLHGAFWDYVVILLFSLYIAYDFIASQECPKTVCNAIDSAVDIYLDILNIFVRVLSRKSSK